MNFQGGKQAQGQRERAEVTTPPRRYKRMDERTSAERGVRRAKEDDFVTPMKVQSASYSSSSSMGDHAPMRDRKIKSRPEFVEDDSDNDLESRLSDMMRSCAKIN